MRVLRDRGGRAAAAAGRADPLRQGLSASARTTRPAATTSCATATPTRGSRCRSRARAGSRPTDSRSGIRSGARWARRGVARRGVGAREGSGEPGVGGRVGSRAGAPRQEVQALLRKPALRALTVLAGGALLLLLALTAWQKRRRPPATFARGSDAAPELARLLARLDRAWTRRGVPRPPSRGLLEHVQQIESARLPPALQAAGRQTVEAYYRARFGGTGASAASDRGARSRPHPRGIRALMERAGPCPANAPGKAASRRRGGSRTTASSSSSGASCRCLRGRGCGSAIRSPGPRSDQTGRVDAGHQVRLLRVLRCEADAGRE